MKNFKFSIIHFSLALVLAACGSKEEATESTNKRAATEEKATEESGPAYPMTVSPTIASTER